MKIQTLGPQEALASLQSGPEGLAEAEAERRLAIFQANRILHLRAAPWWRRFVAGFIHFLAIVLWLAAGLAFFAEWRDPGKGMATLGVAIICVILINALFSYWQEYRAGRSILALERLMPDSVRVLRDGRLRKLNRALLVPGDVVLLSAGDNVPADCRVLEAFDVRINMAALTGESYPVARDAEPSDAPDLLHCRNILLAGTTLLSGEARTLIYATGMRTEFGRIAHLIQAGGDVESPLQRQINRLSRLIAMLAVLLGLVFFGLGQWIGLGFWNSFLFAIGIIVANVPEGLLPTVTLSLAMGAQRMAAKQALIRHLPSVETLGSATVICTDKTGTLTLNRMEARVAVCAGREIDLSGQPATLPHSLRAVASLCQTLQRGEVDGRQVLVGDPLEEALLRMAQNAGGQVNLPLVDELPFSAERRMLSTLHRAEQGLLLFSKGALEALLPLSFVGSGAAPRGSWAAGTGFRPPVGGRGLPAHRTGAGAGTDRPGGARRPTQAGGAGRRPALPTGGHPHLDGDRRPSPHGGSGGTGNRPDQGAAQGHQRRGPGGHVPQPAEPGAGGA
jgi:sodium/potassium-transporting ATPase subunit alpha